MLALMRFSLLPAPDRRGGAVQGLLGHAVHEPEPDDLRDLAQRGGDLLLPAVRLARAEAREDAILLVLTRADDEWEAELGPIGRVERREGRDFLRRQSVEAGR